MLKQKLFLIDATAFCYRAFYAIRGLSTSFGQPTNAVYGFLNMFLKILKEKKPEYLAVCFDISRDTFRQKKFAEYKSQRPSMPDELSSQIPLIKQIIAAYRIPIFEKEGYEADDIIASLAEKAKKSGMASIVVSNDKDLLQLVDEDITVLSPHKDEDIIYDTDKVLERYGIKPQQIADIVALVGDAVDNIPGVKGITEKRAAELIQKFGSIENLFKHVDEIRPDKLKQTIKDNYEQIKLNRELVVLNKEMELDFSLDKLKIGEPDYRQLFKLFKHLEFKALLKSLPAVEEKTVGLEVKILKDKELKDLVSQQDELFLYSPNADDLVFCVKGKFFRTDSIGKNLKAILANPRIRKISHDLKKIKISLNKEKIVLEGLFFDTKVSAYLINPSKVDYDLTELAWDYLEKSLRADSLDSAEALTIILQLVPKLEEELLNKKLIKLFSEIEMPLVEVLAQMEITGIKLDLKLLKKLSRDLEKRLAVLIADIYKISEYEFNINSPKQLRQVLFDKLKLPVVKKTKTGASTDEEVLNKLADEHELPAKLLEYRQLNKLKSTYIDALPKLVDPGTKKVHTSFNQTATETGRLSSSNPNLQNLPIKTDLGKRIREAIIAFSHHSYLLSCDYSQIELRILAHISQDKTLITAFKEDSDIHKKTASLIYGLDEKDITDSMREMAKRVNFGIVYGLSAFGLSRDLTISLEEAQGFIDAYFARYPKVKEYIDEQIARAEKEGFVTTILGRRRYLPQIKNNNQFIRQLAQRQAVNTPIQGSASDIIKLAMVEIHNQIRNAGLKGRMILQIHDELVFDVPEGELKEFITLIKDKMEHVLKLDVPIKVDIKVGRNWSQMEEVKG
jgi:DNA polymerase-1